MDCDDLPSNSQLPLSFHPDFDREVFPVVFSVGAIVSLTPSRMINTKYF